MKKPTLYIIHGWTYTVAPWERTIAALEKQGIKVQMLNVPGLTASSKKVWTIEEYVHWADRQIPDGAVALGHSNGGRILLNLCSEKPDKLKHLILLDAAGVYEASTKRDFARILSKKLAFLKNVPGLTKIWHKLIGASDYARAPENMKQTLANMLESDKKLDLQKITVPTSILWGANDTVTPPHQGKIMHESIAGSTFELYPGWTHAPYISHPIELAKAIFRAYKKPPEKPLPAEITKTAEISASMALKKAAEPVVPSTAEISASMALKKAARPTGTDTAKLSATLAVPSSKKPTSESGSVLSEIQGVEYEKANLELPKREVITSASVAKVGRIEKLRRSRHQHQERKQQKRQVKQAKRQHRKAERSARRQTGQPAPQGGRSPRAPVTTDKSAPATHAMPTSGRPSQSQSETHTDGRSQAPKRKS